MPHCDFMNQGQTMERINYDNFSSVLYQHVEINFFIFYYFGTKCLKCCCCKCVAINFPANPPSSTTKHICHNKLNTQFKLGGIKLK